MAIEHRKALQHVHFTFDADTLGEPRLKSGVVLQFISGTWDTERDDPRPRDGFNAPIDLPPQKGFWVSGTTSSYEQLTLEGKLPADLAAYVNAAALKAVGSMNARAEAMQAEIKSLTENHAQEKVRADQAETIVENVRKKAADNERQMQAALDAEQRKASESNPALKTLRQTLGTWT